MPIGLTSALLRVLRAWMWPSVVVLTCCAGVACDKAPLSPSGAITVTVAAPASPANGALFANLAQPVTLTITNATTTDVNVSVIYTFDVATDSGFTNKVVTKDVPQGTGQTSLTLDTLPAGTTYYWRARATAGDMVGTYSGPRSFAIGPAITLQAPASAAPASGSTVTTARPTLTIANASHTGPVSTITYRFDIATDATFATVVASSAVTETLTYTSFTPPAALAYRTTYYWRARATDSGSSISGGYSSTATFVTPADPNGP